MLESKPVASKGLLKPLRAVNEKHGGAVVFLAKFFEKNLRQPAILSDPKRGAAEFVRLRIDSGIQPVLLIIDLDHRFVERDVIQTSALIGL